MMMHVRLGSSTVFALSLSLSLLVTAALPSCGDRASEPAPVDKTATQTDELSTLGTERAIPLRIVMTAYDCNNPPPPQPATCTACTDAGTDCGPDTADFGEIRHAVERVNAIMRPLAVQFYVERIEKFKMPFFWDDSNDVNEFQWTYTQPPYQSLQAQLTKVFPSLVTTTFGAADQFSWRRWLAAATIRAGEPREIVVFVAGNSSGFDGRRPWDGASSLVADGAIFRIPFKLAHELGHILGLEHTMYPGAANPQFPQFKGSKNPEKPSDLDWGDHWDYWELVYGIEPMGGAPHYFSSRTEAWSWWNVLGLPLYPKHRFDDGNQNCSIDANCTLKCCIGELGKIDLVTKNCISGTLQTIGNPGIAGLGFTFKADNPGGGTYRRGANVMMYLSDQSNTCEQWGSVSESQAEQVKRLLRADVRIDSDKVGAAMSACVPSTGFRCFTAKRHLLGDYRPRWSIERLDFDQHTSRDLAVWQPPSDAGGACGDGICGLSESASSCAADCAGSCGDGFCNIPPSSPPETPNNCPKDCATFRALLSGGNYATLLERNLGRPGDVPVPANYDTDNVTDFAVLRRGGLNGSNPFDSQFYWIWCKSATNPSCSDPGVEAWGYQYDVPLAGLEFDGNTGTREVAVYRPSTKALYWKVIGQSTWGSVNLGAVGSRIVHLHGLYDADNKTDIVVYEPELARFYILTSTTSWNPAQAIVRTFDPVLKADAMGAADAGAGAPAIRHGGVPLPAENAGRRVLRVWDPYTGNWHTMWSPLTSSTIQTSQWGSPRDIPLAGPIDRNADGKTDLVVFRPTQVPPYVHICSPGNLSPCTNTYSFAVGGATARSVIAAVPDISGDGLGDLIIVDPDQLTWRRFHSPNFVEQPTLTLGDPGATIL